MGVLKVKQLDGSWRDVGCGGGAPYYDDFERPDEVPIGYPHVGTANLIGGKYVCGSSTCSIFHVRSGGVTDVYGEFLVTAATTSSHHLLVSLVNSTGTAYIYFGFDTFDVPFIGGLPLGGSDIARAVGTTPHKTNGATYRMRLTRSGDTYTANLNGVDLLTYTDSAFADCGAIVEFGLGTSETCDEITVGGNTAVGRFLLRLPDGSWVREACDGETGHQLKVWDGAAWEVAACMVPV